MLDAINVQDDPKRTADRAVLQVLVVDDDPLARQLIGHAVRDLGYPCREAADGVEATRMLEERHADVVISDWDMPRMNGVELCRRTRVHGDESPYVYFILMTAFGDREHLLAGMAAGADDYQKKPIDLDELEARLVSARRVVALHRRLAERNTELRHDSKKFYVASRTDPLTGLGNRRRLSEELEGIYTRARRYGTTCSIAMLDLDRFKTFNDRFGHLAGDDALRRVSEAVRSAVRESDGVFRYGGEEILVVLHEQRLDEATQAMERVRRAIERLEIPSVGGPLTASIGIAELDTVTDANADEWVRRADVALYRAKTAGRNRVVPA